MQTIRLSADGDQVDIENDIDWHESHMLLKAAFPLAASGPFATYEIPYGTIERPTTRNNSWEKAQFEVPAQHWADLGDGKHGLSLINDSKFGYDAVGNLLRLTLLRSPKWPDPDADMGHHHFHYALYPHAGTWKDAMTVRHGFEYNYPLTAVVTTAHAGSLPAEHSFASVAPENVVLTAVKKAEDAKGLIFRVYEWAGKESTVEFHVPPGATGATVTNMMETPEGSPLAVDRRCGQGADSSVRDSDHAGGLSERRTEGVAGSWESGSFVTRSVTMAVAFPPLLTPHELRPVRGDPVRARMGHPDVFRFDASHPGLTVETLRLCSGQALGRPDFRLGQCSYRAI